MRRVKWGVGGVVVLGLAWLISMLLPFNWGNFGLGTTGGNSGPSAVPTEKVRQKDEPERKQVSVSDLVNNPKRTIGGEGVLDVRIADHDYYLRSGTAENPQWVVAKLESVVALARQAPGNDLGIRVRVQKAHSARASTETALKEALRGAGLQSGEVLFLENLAD